MGLIYLPVSCENSEMKETSTFSYMFVYMFIPKFKNSSQKRRCPWCLEDDMFFMFLTKASGFLMWKVSGSTYCWRMQLFLFKHFLGGVGCGNHNPRETILFEQILGGMFPLAKTAVYNSGTSWIIKQAVFFRRVMTLHWWTFVMDDPLGGAFKYCLCSPRIPGEMIQVNEHIFQMGWFNHSAVHIEKVVFFSQESWGLWFVILCKSRWSSQRRNFGFHPLKNCFGRLSVVR